MNLKEYLKEKRSTLSDSSVNTYASILKSLHKKVVDNKDIERDDFNECERILHFLRDIPVNKRKTILSALVVLTEKNEYRTRMNEDVCDYNREIDRQEKTETQRENWIEESEIRDIYTILENDAKILFKKNNKTTSDMQQIQNYVIISLLGGIYIPPRRSVDYCAMKIKNVDREDKTHNHINKNKFVFNKYKTAKTYGCQEVEIPQQLKSILNRWIAINPTDYLLFSSNQQKLTSPQVTRMLNQIFGKQVSTNLLRHIYLTDKYGKLQAEMQRDSHDMAHSMSMQADYIKK